MHTNLDSLKELVFHTLETFIASAECRCTEATKQMRSKFGVLQGQVSVAADFETVAHIIKKARGMVRANKFFLPKALLNTHERLVALDWLAHQMFLVSIPWGAVLRKADTVPVQRPYQQTSSA